MKPAVNSTPTTQAYKAALPSTRRVRSSLTLRPAFFALKSCDVLTTVKTTMMVIAAIRPTAEASCRKSVKL